MKINNFYTVLLLILIFFVNLNCTKDSLKNSIIPETKIRIDNSNFFDSGNDVFDQVYMQEYVNNIKEHLRKRGNNEQIKFYSLNLDVFVVTSGRLSVIPNSSACPVKQSILCSNISREVLQPEIAEKGTYFDYSILKNMYEGWHIGSVNPMFLQLGSWIKSVKICRIRSPWKKKERQSMSECYYNGPPSIKNPGTSFCDTQNLPFRVSNSDRVSGVPDPDFTAIGPALSTIEGQAYTKNASTNSTLFENIDDWVYRTDNLKLEIDTDNEDWTYGCPMDKTFTEVVGSSTLRFINSPVDSIRILWHYPQEGVLYSIARFGQLTNRMNADASRNLIGHEIGHNHGLGHSSESFGIPCSYAIDPNRVMFTPIFDSGFRFDTCEIPIAQVNLECYLNGGSCIRHNSLSISLENPPIDLANQGLGFIADYKTYKNYNGGAINGNFFINGYQEACDYKIAIDDVQEKKGYTTVFATNEKYGGKCKAK